ncbi:mitochondrial carrier [Stereum hirsutum FP-91666 SS1]|uniref:mitochondrial carrier n=1 Tax=Stereum hirsutum (strain FP-91666) TaxID=721885 RepID=UPI000440AE59|nr:mitochondrial carrier [Stereum hirsutum FP-91666 SS1]EIM91363.1 mitochondrial carrier [Stereum hirsutum FP-91666 SS1]
MPVQSKPTQLTPFGYALAGALGGCFSNAIVYPLDTIKTRIQASNVEEERTGKRSDLSIHHLVVSILKEEGIAGYYRGFAATMINTFSMQYAYFFFYSLVRTSYIKRLAARRAPNSPIPALSTAAELALGALAGALAQVFTIPVSVIATRQQIGRRQPNTKTNASATATTSPTSDSAVPSSVGADKGKAPSYASVAEKGDVSEASTLSATDVPPSSASSVSDDDEYEDDDSFLGVAHSIIKEDGITGLWLGMGPSLVLTVNPAITYGAYERVKSVMVMAQEKAGQGRKLGPWTSFMLGAISKTLATVVTYPYIMAKVRIQAGAEPFNDSEKEKDNKDKAKEHSLLPPPATSAPTHAHHHHVHHKHAGAINILHHVLRTQGFFGWYQGMGAQITKAVLSQAILFMSREKLEHWALAIMVLWWKVKHGHGRTSAV